MSVGAVGEYLVAALDELVAEGAWIRNHLFAVLFEVLAETVLERNGNSADCVVVWTAVEAWEDRFVDLSLVIVEDLEWVILFY